MKEINTFFYKTDKHLNYKYLFDKDGNLIENYEDINPEQCYNFVSQIG